MPLNQAQRDFLDAPHGIESYLETVQDNPSLNTGTKILYLRRAIYQENKEFMQSLDRLYQQLPMNQANLALIIVLKTINDLTFNNEIKYGEYGIRLAVDHYLHQINKGKPDYNAVQIYMKAAIHQHIWKMRESAHTANVDITQEITEYQEKEAHIPLNPKWRLMADLPEAQLLPDQILYIRKVKDLFEKFHIYLDHSVTFHQFLTLPNDIRQLITHSSVNAINFSCLFYCLKMTYPQLLKLHTKQLEQLLVHFHSLKSFVKKTNTPFEKIIELTADKMCFIFTNYDKISFLITNCKIQLDDFSILNDKEIHLILNRKNEIVALHRNFKICIKDILKLPFEKMTLFLNNTSVIQSFLEKVSLNIADIMKLNPHKLRLLNKNRFALAAIFELINLAKNQKIKFLLEDINTWRTDHIDRIGRAYLNGTVENTFLSLSGAQHYGAKTPRLFNFPQLEQPFEKTTVPKNTTYSTLKK